jgi:hypothetical protein
MLPVKCVCGEEHDLSDMEPILRAPQAVLDAATRDRGRVEGDRNLCVLRDDGEAINRWFARVLAPVPVAGRQDPCCWGIWVELSHENFGALAALWDDPPTNHAPIAATLANDLGGDYPPSLGLPGTIRFRDPKKIPFLTLDAAVDHPFAREMREGVRPERMLEWFAPWLHASGRMGPAS